MNADAAAIRELGHRWTRALAARDLTCFTELIADDIVVVHGNGRVVAGAPAVLDDLRAGLARARVEQTVQPQETVVLGDWAFERARVHTRLASVADGSVQESDSQTLTILRKDRAGRWRIARVMGVVEQIR